MKTRLFLQVTIFLHFSSFLYPFFLFHRNTTFLIQKYPSCHFYSLTSDPQPFPDLYLPPRYSCSVSPEGDSDWACLCTSVGCGCRSVGVSPAGQYSGSCHHPHGRTICQSEEQGLKWSCNTYQHLILNLSAIHTCTVMYMYMTHIDIYLYEFQPFHSTMVNFNTGWCLLINIETFWF